MSRIPKTVVLLALACACNASNEADADEKLSLVLDLEIRDSASMQLTRTGEELDVSLALSKGFGVVADGARVAGKGRLERFPEADVALYTARFSLPPQADGPCGEQPVSLALALHRRGDGPRLSGSLTPYCGTDVWFGTPARSPLRMSSPAAEDE